jgi:hypothetical protein
MRDAGAVMVVRATPRGPPASYAAPILPASEGRGLIVSPGALPASAAPPAVAAASHRRAAERGRGDGRAGTELRRAGDETAACRHEHSKTEHGNRPG